MNPGRTTLIALGFLVAGCSTEKAEELGRLESELEALAGEAEKYEREAGLGESENTRRPGRASREWLRVGAWTGTFSTVRQGSEDEEVATAVVRHHQFDESARGDVLLELSENLDVLPGDPFQSWEGTSDDIAVRIKLEMVQDLGPLKTRVEVRGSDPTYAWARLYIDIELGEYALTFDPAYITVERRTWINGKEQPEDCMARGDCGETPPGGVVDEQLPAECCVIKGSRSLERGVVFTWELRPK